VSDVTTNGSGTAQVPAVDLESVFRKVNEHEQKGELDAAEGLLRSTFGVNPTHVHAIHMSGILAFRRGRAEEARQRMERSMLIAPKVPLYPRNLCEVYRSLGRYDDALAAGNRAVTLAPNDPVAHVNLAIVHYDRGEPDHVIACADRALSLAPDSAAAHFERAKGLLVSGRLADGWEEYEWRFRLPGAGTLIPHNDKPQWDGRALGDTPLVLVADQGFGDVIQFSRYIPWVVERCSNVVIAAGLEVRPLMQKFSGVRAVVSRWEDAGAFACYCPLSGLPRLHGTRLETIPAEIPYLRSDPVRAANWRTRLDALLPAGYRRVAISWAGRRSHKNDRTRSVRLESFAPLAALEKTALISLQKGTATTEVGAYLGMAPLLNLGPDLHDFEDTAAVLDAVDLLVCVDTAVGHLAGALGRPAWLALADATDWRWLTKREDSPWYPKHRLFRQDAPGAWGPVFDRIAGEIRSMP
jgi:tetratricopeptide (TPR) repeat protein